MRKVPLSIARLLVVIPILLLRPVVDAAPVAAAAPPAPRATLEVEVRDTGARVNHTIRIGIAVDPQGGYSELKTRIDDAYYRFQIRANSPAGTYTFEVERSATDRANDLHVNATRALTAGQRGMLGRITRPDGSSTEVAVVLR